MKDLVEISSLGFSVAKKLTLDAIKSFEDKKTETMDIFYSELFKGLIDEDIISYENEYIKPTQEYCYKLLNAALIDEEKEKAIYYSRLYKYILSNQSIVKSKKLNLLKTLKGLSFESIQLLPILYVYQNYPTTKITSLREYIDNLIKDPDQSYDLNILSQFGILNQVQLAGGHTFEPSTLFDEFISILFQQEDLSPDTLSIKVWAKKILYLVNSLTGTERKYIEDVIGKGSKKTILSQSYNNIIPNKADIELKQFEYIICIFGENKIIDQALNNLKPISRLLKVSIKKGSIDQLPKIAGKMYYIGEDSPNDIEDFIEELKK
mgnify:CR=1 FL=1